ncbi:hypothetical protein [Shinella zoogloeoides]|uniref:hypothetical protein n=1 Tax=Shinella zoogloeoides TaxID=352475 RepID=UPI00299E1CD0|nr:hypothetical protein [Shinella zoogloeoides]WPE19901.1 hypothetical protein ShzoTeo12_10770 [Shinella zoogloeoides]
MKEATRAKLSTREKQAIINSLVTAMALARHSLSPMQTNMATRSAGELLWLLKIDSVTLDGATYVATPPGGETVEMSLTAQIDTTSDADAAPARSGKKL